VPEAHQIPTGNSTGQRLGWASSPVTASPVAAFGRVGGKLPGYVAPHVVEPEAHLQGLVPSQAPDVAAIAAPPDGVNDRQERIFMP
jgi:hypothetical protein